MCVYIALVIECYGQSSEFTQRESEIFMTKHLNVINIYTEIRLPGALAVRIVKNYVSIF